MEVFIRYIDHANGKKVGYVPPSEIQPLIDLLQSGVPVYDFSDDNSELKDCQYYSAQIVKYEDNNSYIFEIVVE